ncbi:MAG: hypothetical protein PHT79_07955 [Syntrophomonadaceae bacterium]|nr:hypothetical protein [Syntrophomonadaceae bacterium]
MLNEVLSRLQKVLNSDNIKGLDERNTERVFVAPILTAIGWNLFNIEETYTGYSPGSPQGPDVSYAFFDEQKPLLLVEIRPLYSDIFDKKITAKALKIAGKTPAKALAITNGVKWGIFILEEENKLVAVTSIFEETAAEMLAMLTRDNIKNGQLDEYALKNPPTEIPATYPEIKARGYKVTDKTHKNLIQVKNKIMTSRKVKDQDISHSNIVETLLEVFYDTLDNFDYSEISNNIILKKHMEEAFRKRFNPKD